MGATALTSRSRVRAGRYAALIALIVQGGCGGPTSGFPPVEPAKVRITLQRSACYGSCPDYKVVIDGSGLVTFTTTTRPTDPVSGLHRRFATDSGIVVEGMHTAQVEPAKVTALLDRAKAMNFFALKPEYRAMITDNPTYVVTIDTGHRTKAVVDYVGLSAGMPKAEQDLEDAIDEVAGTRRWIKGTEAVIPLLQKEGTNFASATGGALMTAAAGRNDVAMMEHLARLGAPIRPSDGGDPLTSTAGNRAPAAMRFLLDHGASGDRESLRSALESAVRSDDGATFRLLLDAGGRAAIDKDEATRLLPSASGNGNLAITTLLLDAGADVRGPEDRRRYEEPAIFDAANGGNTLDDSPKRTPEERRSVVALLLRHGSNIHQCALTCSSVLALVSDPVIAHMLVAAGADPNAKDSDGEPVLFQINNEGVALELIRAGARLDAVRPADKMTLGGWATYQKWPNVLALLRQHGQ